MASQPLAFAELLGGGILLAAALTGSSVKQVVSGNAGPFRGFSVGGGAGNPSSNTTSTTPTGGTPGKGAGGFLPKGASYKAGQKDQGQDFQTDPGGAIIAPGNGKVVSVNSDPSGFGPSYPVVEFTSGPYVGKVIYIGHTIASLARGAIFKAGDVLSVTGTHPIGNATVPGWAEIGYASPAGVPGPFGQATPF